MCKSNFSLLNVLKILNFGNLKIKVYKKHGLLPWYTMVVHGKQWTRVTMENHVLLNDTMVIHGFAWYFMVYYHGISWFITMVYHGILPWFTVVCFTTDFDRGAI